MANGSMMNTGSKPANLSGSVVNELNKNVTTPHVVKSVQCANCNKQLPISNIVSHTSNCLPTL